MGRASILDTSDDETDDLDLSKFAPKPGPDKDALPQEQVRAIAEASNFPSRDPKPRRAVAPAVPQAVAERPAVLSRREPRRHRTGRNTQFSVRTTPETLDAFYAIADSQGWLMAETVERALAALQQALAAKS